MIHKDVYDIFTVVANDKYIRLSAISITSFTVLLAAFFSPLAGLIIYGSYILGYFVCWCLIKYQKTASVYLLGIVNFCFSSQNNRKKLKHSCSICDDLTCRRHQQGKSANPWNQLWISKELNNSIEHFYNHILDDFISSWYKQFTDDVDFVNELRHCLRHASAAVINKFLDLDHANIITAKLLPQIIKHIDDYLHMQQLSKLKNARFNDVIVEYLGKRLHAATANRKSELSYLQHLSFSLIPHILPEKYLSCPNYTILIREILAGWVLLPMMDVLADPNIINSLVIIAATYKPKKHYKSKTNDENVAFLGTFIAERNQTSSFSVTFNAIKADPQLLYCFMQFLKREEHVHLLQFCLDVDEFNNKLLTPDLSKKMLEELYAEANTLHKEYLNLESVNFVGCSVEIVESFARLVRDGVYSVAKLRTSTPLYQAYEYTINVLESVWMPAFFHSNEFYSYICGSKVTATYSKITSNRTRKYYEVPNQSTVAKISSGIGKIKGALKTPQPIEGAIFSPESQAMENGAVEDIIISECGSIFRDLSAWKVAIMSYQSTNKIINFCVDVQRLDAIDDSNKRHWIVLRKDQDFYTLKAKLVEFHGETEICDSPFPSRKAGSPIDVRMTRYENFLNRLLQKPSLRGSDLLYSFLTVEGDFTSSNVQNAQDIGNIYLSVAHKLRKEKGQNLDSFMATFLLSTGKTKPGKFEWGEIGDEIDLKANSLLRNPPIPKTYRNYVFNDNFGINYKPIKDNSNSVFNPTGVSQSLFYLLKYLFRVPFFVLRLYTAICTVGHEAFESLVNLLIERKLKSSLSQPNLAYLITLLEEVVFNPPPTPSKKDLEERKVRAFKEIQSLIPSYLEKIIGDNFNAGFDMLLNILQHPHYNKQLAYNLVDLLLIEMYPDLGKVKE